MQLVVHTLEPRARQEILAAGGNVKDLAQEIDPEYPHVALYLVTLPATTTTSSPNTMIGTHDILLYTKERVVVLQAAMDLEITETSLLFGQEYHVSPAFWEEDLLEGEDDDE
jgi:hypothetical protein